MKGITLFFPRADFLINQDVFPPLGIMYLSAFLKKRDIEVQCIDQRIEDDIDKIKHDVVGISITTPQACFVPDILKKIRKNVITVAGGPHATHMPRECQEMGFHKIIGGYGELSLYQYLTGKEEKIRTIDEFPFPDRDALPIKKYKYTIDGLPSTTLMTSRGCPYDCAFCARISKNCDVQSAQRTYDEILHVHQKYGYSAFMIYDDTFLAYKKRLNVLANMLEKYKFKFRCFGRCDSITPKLCEDLVRLGVVEVGLGVESGSDTILNMVSKKSSAEKNKSAIFTLRKYGIRSKVFIIIGLPGESKETIMDTEKLLDECPPDDVDFTIFQPYPGSNIFNNPKKYDIQFEYTSDSSWYKGKPGEYKAHIKTSKLSGSEIIEYRDYLEEKYKKPDLLR